MAMEGTETQLRKQKRMRITSNREKLFKRNRNRNIECMETSQIGKNAIQLPCFVNKKSYHHVVSMAALKVVKISPNV